MFIADSLILDAPRRTSDGYMAVRAKAARTGTYQYLGSEIDPDNKHGLRDAGMVNILRDQAAVFDEKSAHSFIGKPITDNHPSVAVNAANWRDHARGTVMGAKWEEGGYLAFDLLLTDAATIGAVENGKRELSNGYEAELSFGDFDGPGGVKCVAKQVSIKGNHVAIVDKGRAGPSCAITDTVAVCDSLPSNLFDSLTQESPVPKIVLIDGLSVDVANVDTAATTITTLIAARDAATAQVTDLTGKVSTLTAEGQTKDAKIATLEQQVKDAKPTPAQLRDAGKALLLTAGRAKALGVAVTDAMDEGQIMAATVTAKMGDTAKEWTADQIAASFAVLTKDTKVDDQAVQPLGSPVVVGDAAQQADAAYSKANNDLNAWRAA